MFLYEIRNIINNKIYIGQTIQSNVELRWKDHRNKLNNNEHCNRHLQCAWNRYGKSSFKFSILAEYSSAEELNKAEINTIQNTQSYIRRYGYNLTMGGEGASHVLETRKKLSISASLKVGDKNPFFGKRHSNETKRKIGILSKERMKAGLARKIGDINKERLTGVPFSETHKTKISISTKKSWTPERRKSYAEYRKLHTVNQKPIYSEPILLQDFEGNIHEVFCSITEFSKQNNFSASNLCKYKHTKGWKLVSIPESREQINKKFTSGDIK